MKKVMETSNKLVNSTKTLTLTTVMVFVELFVKEFSFHGRG